MVDRSVGLAPDHDLGRRLGCVLFFDRGLVSPRIPEKGEVDLQAFHAEEGRKYLIAYTILSVATVVTNATLGQGGSAVQWPAQNIVIAPMTVATAIAAIFIARPWVQGLALAIQIVGWFWYFAALLTALAG